MLVQMFNRGIGKGAGPVQYCTATEVPKFSADGKRIPGEFKTRDPAPEVLRGNAQRTEALIDSIANKWKYSSGVIAFADDDAPTESEQQAVIDDFEASVFAGLERDQYDILWIRQTHEGNVELHFVVPRVELTTGKALNGFPPGYQKLTDAWRDKWNYDKGWADPNDPERARVVKRSDHELKLSLKGEDPRVEVTAWLVSRIEAGLIEDRADIVASLEEIGTVTRQGKDYISVRLEGFAKAIRLRGAIYGSDFQRQQLEEAIAAENAAGPAREQAVNPERAREAAQRLAAYVQKRARYNAERYSREPEDEAERHGDVDRTGGADRREDGRTASGEVNQNVEQPLLESNEGDPGAGRSSDGKPESFDREPRESERGSGEGIKGKPTQVDSRLVNWPDRLDDHLRRELGPAAIPFRASSAQSHDDSSAKRDDSVFRRADPWSGGNENRRGVVSGSSPRSGNWLQNWREIARQITDKLRGVNERARQVFSASIGAVERAIRGGYDAARNAEQELVEASSSIERASDTLSRSLDDFEQKIGPSLASLNENIEVTKARIAPASADTGFGAEPQGMRSKF